MILAWVDGQAYGKKGAGISVIMRCGQHEFRRSVLIGKSTSNQAELKAIELVLSSVLPKFRKEIQVKVGGRYGPMMMEREGDQWRRKAHRNGGLVDRIRSLADKFKKCSVKFVQADPVIDQLRRLNEQSVKSGKVIFEKR